MEYRARVKREGHHWLADFPDCPGCQTYGRSKKDALANASEALEGWLEAHLLTGRVPPRPRRRRGYAVQINPRLATAIQLRMWRDQRGLTQAGAAKLAGVSQQQIAKLESPNSNPTLSTLAKVTAALGGRLDVKVGPKEAASA